jgi:hypothetical protein
MAYASGETPEVGDYVKNQWEQPGTVTAVHAAKGGHEQVSIRWDDGGVDLPSAAASEFTLLSRSGGPKESARRQYRAGKAHLRKGPCRMKRLQVALTVQSSMV